MALITEVTLSKLGQINHYKYCIPENSVFMETSLKATTVSQTKDCKLNYLRYGDNEVEKTKKEEISSLFQLITKFIETQHVANILMFYSPSTSYEPPTRNGGRSQDMLKSIASACNLKDSSFKEIIKELFFSPKNCFLSPSFSSIELDVSKSRSLTTTGSDLQRFLEGKIKGTLRYGIFSYSAKLKNITFQDKKDKHFYLNVSWPLTFYLGEERSNACSLDYLWKRVKSRELGFDTIKNICLTFI
ncbi:hypothetical protein OVS_03100 [Mycoplasma ovis str. Michigan]|uniref:Uncharacterized protein n=1 Tax=Mycoplasma ovis str. Michigan TaxID=1415773 RepID=A0ABN4BPW6_9MOLU|nr:hypothetical protein [Mycoplasma ovis]AHC40379.1 hypothetical protein OVS_03100 [Mycoplasma ovis str. Michigan]